MGALFTQPYRGRSSLSPMGGTAALWGRSALWGRCGAMGPFSPMGALRRYGAAPGRTYGAVRRPHGCVGRRAELTVPFHAGRTSRSQSPQPSGLQPLGT